MSSAFNLNSFFFLKFVVDLVNGKMLLYLMQLHDLHQFIVCREQLNFNSC